MTNAADIRNDDAAPHWAPDVTGGPRVVTTGGRCELLKFPLLADQRWTGVGPRLYIPGAQAQLAYQVRTPGGPLMLQPTVALYSRKTFLHILFNPYGRSHTLLSMTD